MPVHRPAFCLILLQQPAVVWLSLGNSLTRQTLVPEVEGFGNPSARCLFLLLKDIHKAIERCYNPSVREMSEEEIRQVGETGRTGESIEVAEFESNDALKEWTGTPAPAFLW